MGLGFYGAGLYQNFGSGAEGLVLRVSRFEVLAVEGSHRPRVLGFEDLSEVPISLH